MNNAGGTRRRIKLAVAGMLVATGLLAAPATAAHAATITTIGGINPTVNGGAHGNVGAGQVVNGSAEATTLAAQQAAMQAARAKVEAQSALLAAQARANGNVQSAAVSLAPSALAASAARGSAGR